MNMTNDTIHEDGHEMELTPERADKLNRMGLLCKCDICPHWHIKMPGDWHDIDMAIIQIAMDERE